MSPSKIDADRGLSLFWSSEHSGNRDGQPFRQHKETTVSGAKRLVWINGEMAPESEARISIFDVGRLYGATFYESIRTFRHKLFKLEEHLVRLKVSLVYAGLAGLVARREVSEAIQAVYGT